MPYMKTIICFANSFKHGGRCIAGKEIEGGTVRGWIRPISNREGAEISYQEQRYSNNAVPSLLDLVQVSLSAPAAHGYQSENHLIDLGVQWSTPRAATSAEVEACLDTVVGPLWDNSLSSANGLHDSVSEAIASGFDYSLKLVRVESLVISLSTEGGFFGPPKRKYRGSFTLAGERYTLSITDPAISQRYSGSPNGNYNVGQAVLCISLGEPFIGHAYKLIAGVIFPPQT